MRPMGIDKIKPIKMSCLEIMLSKREYLERALCSKDADKSKIQVVESKVPHLSLRKAHKIKITTLC